MMKNHLIAISLDGNNIVKVPFPSQVDGDYYFDLFTRNDTMYVRPYWTNSGCFRFDYDNWNWEEIPYVTDVIYEDADYQVVYKNLGEWGKYSWFEDKQTHKQYLHPEISNRIVPNLGDYYFVKQGCLCRMNDPKKGMKCTAAMRHSKRDFLHEIIKIQTADINYNADRKYERSIEGAEPIYCFPEKKSCDGNSSWTPWVQFDTVISNMISFNDQLYLWTVTDDDNFISTIRDGRLTKILDMPQKYQVFSWAESYRGCNFAPNQFLMQFREDPWTTGLIDMVDTTISIHYLIHNQDSLSFIGEDNIQPTLEFLLGHKNHLTLSMIDSLERQFGGIPSTIVKNVYEDESYNKRRPTDEDYMKIRYYRLVDSSLVVEMEYYFNRCDSVVSEFRLSCRKPNYYASSVRHVGVKAPFTPTVFDALKEYFTEISGQEPVSGYPYATWKWSYGGQSIMLWENFVAFVRSDLY